MQDAPWVLGIDAGTSAVRAIAWSLDGRPLAEGRAQVAIAQVGPDGFEQGAEDWWQALAQATWGVVDRLGVERLAGVALAQQRETFVVCDEDSTPRRGAILWMDERALAQVEQVRAAGLAEQVHAATGKPVCVTPSLYKLMWLRAHEPETLRGARVCDVHGWMVRRLTGAWATSTASADPMGLLDLERGAWHAQMLALAGLDEAQLPALHAPGSILGTVCAEAARRTGLPAGLPVVAGAGDGQAAALGAGLGAGELYLNLGTAVVSGAISAAARRDLRFRTLIGAAPGTYLCEADLKGGTFTLNWLVRRWLDPSADEARKRALLAELEAQAALLAPGAEGLITLPYWCGVMNPYWDDRASGLTMGWRERHGPAHLYRSILEGIALEQRLVTDGFEEALGQRASRLVAVGGGAQRDLWCQILADATGRELVRAHHVETTSLGAASLAAFGVGLVESPDALARAAPRGQTFRPGPHADAYDALYREVYAPLYPRVRDLMGHLARA